MRSGVRSWEMTHEPGHVTPVGGERLNKTDPQGEEGGRNTNCTSLPTNSSCRFMTDHPDVRGENEKWDKQGNSTRRPAGDT